MDESARKRAILILCCVAQFMTILDVSVVNIALPSIATDLNFSPTGLEWVVNAYTLGFGGFLLLGGRAADILGRRTMFVGRFGAVRARVPCRRPVDDSGMLIAARAAQGIGAAVVAPATLSVLSATFVTGAERNRAMGAWGAMGGVGGVAGGVLGGVITQYLGWEWTLFINVPIGIVCAAVAARVLEHDERPEERRNFDALGAIVITAGLTSLTYGIVSTHEHGWTSAQTLIPMIAGVLLIAAFVAIESSSPPGRSSTSRSSGRGQSSARTSWSSRSAPARLPCGSCCRSISRTSAGTTRSTRACRSCREPSGSSAGRSSLHA